MKKCITQYGALLIYSLALATMQAAISDEIKQAITKGAKAQITFRVVDSKGNPVAEAQVGVGFYNQNMSGDGGGVSGKTDSSGLFTAIGKPTVDMHYQIYKEGYYNIEGSYVFYRASDPNPVKDGRWQPWNPTNTVVLKEKRNPVPMFAKNIDVPILVWAVPIGFDLEKGDWIAPYGNGIHPDIFFTYSADIKDIWTGTYVFTIACSNKLDGFFRTEKDTWSQFASRYEAPTNEYLMQIIQTLDRTKYKTLKDEKVSDTEYVAFRVRTIVNEEGKIVGSKYGKIYGPIESGVGKQYHMRFTYYLNPDGTRNLEFDPKRNLFKNLKPLEQVTAP